MLPLQALIDHLRLDVLGIVVGFVDGRCGARRGRYAPHLLPARTRLCCAKAEALAPTPTLKRPPNL